MEKEEILNKKLGEKLILFRKNRNLSRKTIADILDISQQQFEKYEKGVNKISAIKLFLIMEKFNIDIDFFMETLNNNQNNNKLELLKYYFLNIKDEKTRDLLLEISKKLTDIK